MHKFTTPLPEQVFPDETLKKSLQSITDNAAKALGNKLSKNAGVGKDSYKAEQTFVGLSNIEYNLANFNSMSDLEKKKFFRAFRYKALLDLIDFLISRGVEMKMIQDMKRRITTPGLSLPFDEILRLMHTYINHKYSIANPPITTSDLLVQFITYELPILSDVMSPYYGASKDLIDFRIYLPLIRIYIRLILMEAVISFASDSTTVATSIVDRIREKLCHFFTIAGDPNIVILTSTLGNVIILITQGVSDFLNVAVPGAVPDTVSQGDGAAAGAANEGGNRRRIKKYKNRSSRRSSRRTSRRTSRVTKYRTNRYKIKNKKTRKTRKTR
jgi:hypothetical protein